MRVRVFLLIKYAHADEKQHDLAFGEKNVKMYYRSQSRSRNGWVTPRCTTIFGKCKFCPSYAVNNVSQTSNCEGPKLMPVIQGMLKKVPHLISEMTKDVIKQNYVL